MKHIQRQDIHIFARHGNLNRKKAEQALEDHVYSSKPAWLKFFRLLFITLGAGFTVSGIVFFFAYNWADLHKFAKIGLTEGLVILTTALVFLPGISTTLRNILLTGASLLTGVLFAVFGQVYQTGADAYDLFLSWTLFITLWVWIAKFPPLWLLYLVLINTTFILYTQQVARDWSPVLIHTILFVINTAVLLFAMTFSRKTAPGWLLNTVALGAVTFATTGVVNGIFGAQQTAFPVLIIITTIVFAWGIRYGRKNRSGFYLSVIPFSLIIMASSLLIKISDGEIMFLLVSIFVVAGVTLTIRNLIHLQKKRPHEE